MTTMYWMKISLVLVFLSGLVHSADPTEVLNQRDYFHKRSDDISVRNDALTDENPSNSNENHLFDKRLEHAIRKRSPFEDRYGKRGPFGDRFGKRSPFEDRYGKRSPFSGDRLGKRFFEDRFGKRISDLILKRSADMMRLGKRSSDVADVLRLGKREMDEVEKRQPFTDVLRLGKREFSAQDALRLGKRTLGYSDVLRLGKREQSLPTNMLRLERGDMLRLGKRGDSFEDVLRLGKRDDESDEI